MTVPMHALAAETFGPMLTSLSAWLDKGEAYAGAQGIDPGVLVQARLAPDMFTLSQQVTQACRYAVGVVAQLGGRPELELGPDAGDFAGLRARITATIAFVEGADPAAFAGAEAAEVILPGPPGLEFAFTGLEFLRDWAIPHFYFHLVTAYDILRHNGVELGKLDYLARVGPKLRPRAAG